jgi:hypothetical protein
VFCSNLSVESDHGASAATQPGTQRIRVPRVRWAALTIVTTFVASSALWVAVTAAGDQTELIGRTWEQFAVQDPEVA